MELNHVYTNYWNPIMTVDICGRVLYIPLCLEILKHDYYYLICE